MVVKSDIKNPRSNDEAGISGKGDTQGDNNPCGLSLVGCYSEHGYHNMTKVSLK